MKLIKSFVPHFRCFGSYFDVIFLMYLVSSGFSFKPTSSCSSSSSSTQFSQEWARRKVVVKHSIKSKKSLTFTYMCSLWLSTTRTAAADVTRTPWSGPAKVWRMIYYIRDHYIACIKWMGRPWIIGWMWFHHTFSGNTCLIRTVQGRHLTVLIRQVVLYINVWRYITFILVSVVSNISLSISILCTDVNAKDD